ncbi:hypothetical protein [Sodaliphilus sp.]|uniref:hypothetical protein n=1 Tax=Sodaliphilus sp. TaxID=2815818 RepID=UPI00389055B4
MSTVFYNRLHNEQQRREFLSDLFSTMFFGNFWARARLDEDTHSTYARKGDCLEDVWARAILDGCALTVTDMEEGEEHGLTLEDILTGLDLLQANNPSMWARVVENDGSADMIDCDAVLQYAVFGEWIYG